MVYLDIKRVYYHKCEVKVAALKLNVWQLIENPLFVFIINEFMVLQTLFLHLPLFKSLFFKQFGFWIRTKPSIEMVLSGEFL